MIITTCWMGETLAQIDISTPDLLILHWVCEPTWRASGGREPKVTGQVESTNNRTRLGHSSHVAFC